jgi:hypothetical protein
MRGPGTYAKSPLCDRILGVSKDANIYQEMAAIAHGWGYRRTSAAALHDWRKRGLLPPAIIHRGGFGGSSGEIPAEALTRLRAICRLRYDESVRDLRLIGLLLWLDDADIPLWAVRNGVESFATAVSRYAARSTHRARQRDVDDPDADLDAMAVTIGRSPGPLAQMFGGTPVDSDELEVAALEMLRTITGREANPDPEALRPIARTMGLELAATDAPLGVEPWLSGDAAAALRDPLVKLSEAGILRALADATDQDLLDARGVSRDLASSFGKAARLMKLVGPPGAYGLGFLDAVDRDGLMGRALLFLNAVLQPNEAATAAIAFAESTREADTLVALGSLWLSEHPEFVEEAHDRGLTAVLNDLVTERAHTPG